MSKKELKTDIGLRVYPETPGNKICHCIPDPADKLHPPIEKIQKTTRAVSSLTMSFLIAFFPKCPVCWAVYMSMFSSLGFAQIPYMRWLLPVLILLLIAHLLFLWRQSAQKGYMPFTLSLSGACFILIAKTYFPTEQWILFAGMFCIVSGSLLHSFRGSSSSFSLFKKS